MREPRGYLIERMRDHADKFRLPADHPVRVTADEAERTVIRHGATVLDVKRAMQRARVVWSNHSGERVYDD